MNHLQPIMLIPRDGFEHLLVERCIEEREMLHVSPSIFNLQALHTCTCQMYQLPKMLPRCMHEVECEVLGIHNFEVTSHPHAEIMKLV